MPELPDVETFKRNISSKVKGERIDNVRVLDASMLESKKSDMKKLEKNRIKDVSRYGKYLILESEKNALMFHFGMTGSISYSSKGARPEHAKLILEFDDADLSFVNRRKFGQIKIYGSTDDLITDKGLGPDAMRISKKRFHQVMGKKKGKVKSALMDQSTIAGIGNIYADEILFHSYIRPDRKMEGMGDDEIDRIYDRMKHILRESIKSRADPEKMPQDYLIRRRKQNEDCPLGNGKLKRMRINGRSTYYCPEHQE